jgi:hypothetical protein
MLRLLVFPGTTGILIIIFIEYGLLALREPHRELSPGLGVRRKLWFFIFVFVLMDEYQV